MPPVTPPKPPPSLGERMIGKCSNLLHLPETTNAQRQQALRELLEWASETLHQENRWQAAIEKRRVARPPST